MLSKLKTPHLNSQKAVQATEAIIGVRTIISRKSITGSVERACRYYVTRDNWSSNHHEASLITQRSDGTSFKTPVYENFFVSLLQALILICHSKRTGRNERIAGA